MPVGLAREISRQLKRQRLPRPIRMARNVAALVLVTAILFLTLELGVRLLRLAPAFSFPAHQGDFVAHLVRQLNAEFETDALMPDDWLLWRFKPGSKFSGSYVSELGYLGFYRSGPQGGTSARTILILGDELACLGAPTFPNCLYRLLRDGRLRRSFAVVNASVPRYSTTQLLRWKEHFSQLDLAAVIVCAGSADGSDLLGLPDQYLGFRGLWREVLEYAEWSHLARICLYGFRFQQEEAIASGRRVPLHEFEANVKALVAWSRSKGACPILITRPPLPATASSRHWDSTTMTLVAESSGEQSRYNEVMRRVALENHTELVDLEQEFLRRPTSLYFDERRKALSFSGHNLVARLVMASLKRAGIMTQSEFDQVIKHARYDTAAPDRPKVAWLIRPPCVEVTTLAQPLRFEVVMANTGNTTWLSCLSAAEGKTKVGGTSVYTRWEPLDTSTTETVEHGPSTRWELPLDVQPGEATSHTIELPPPPLSGSYALWFGLQADGIGALVRYGAEETSVAVSGRGQLP